MSALETASEFFDACETGQGWAACAAFSTENAAFTAQSEPLVEISTLEGYCEWMRAFVSDTAPGATYTLHSSSWDEANRTALFFATFHGTHTGEAGPVAPTGKTTHSHYVYAITVNDAGKVAAMTKIWNAGWATRELGWTD